MKTYAFMKNNFMEVFIMFEFIVLFGIICIFTICISIAWGIYEEIEKYQRAMRIKKIHKKNSNKAR